MVGSREILICSEEDGGSGSSINYAAVVPDASTSALRIPTKIVRERLRFGRASIGGTRTLLVGPVGRRGPPMTRAAATIVEHRAAEGTTVLHLMTPPPKSPTPPPPSSSLALIDEACLMRDFPDCAPASVRVVASPSRARTYLLSIAPREKRVHLPLPTKQPIPVSASSSNPTALARVEGLSVRIHLFSAPPFDTATTVDGRSARLLSPAELVVDLAPFAPVPALSPLRLDCGGNVVEVPVVMS